MRTTLLLSTAVLLASSVAVGQPAAPARQSSTPQDRPAASQTAEKGVIVSNTFRTEKLQGLKVKNPEGEELGSLHDLVLDMENHRVRYAALSHGGFLGIGDKLFAIPIEALRLKHDGDDTFFVVDIDKETLKTAPGFSQDAWPDFANQEFIAGMEKHYGRYQTFEGTVESTANDRLVITDRIGRQQTFNIGPHVRIMTDGDKADLNDLRQGQHVQLTLTERDGKQVVTTIRSSVERTARQPQRNDNLPRNR